MAPYLGSDNPTHLDSEILPLPSFNQAFPHFYQNPEGVARSLDPFTVNSTTGFLPNKLPVKDLPEVFASLQMIVEDMPVRKLDGTAGLLATYQLGPLIDEGKALLDLTDCIDELKVPGSSDLDLHIITALFRDYSFLASAYLLEPCWKTWNEGGSERAQSGGGCLHEVQGSAEYGLGRAVLPSCIARPLVKLGEILDIPPFMSYAASYALYNYYLVDETKGHEDYSNLRLIRAFEKGLDSLSSEAGFILTHIFMVRSTGLLLEGAIKVLESIEKAREDNAAEHTIRVKESLQLILRTMETIEVNMDRMWANSLPKDYPTYRTFIFGITSQKMFPKGVVYEGCFDDKPVDFRGESGANDSIIPLLDNICQVEMPKNPLTTILREFRGYRPESQRSVLTWTESKATELGTRQWFTSAGPEIAILYLKVLNHIRSFRWRHWMFAREYILKQSKYPVATGGSPIVTWLPNNLAAVMDMMENVYRDSGLQALVAEGQFHGGGKLVDTVKDQQSIEEIMDIVAEQKVKLEKEVRKYCEERGV